MALTLLVGGARSGKSTLAVRLAHDAATAAARPVTFIATAQALDDEMAHRIHRHRRERPAHWLTVEAPTDLGPAIASAPADTVVVVDCLSLWVTNLLLADGAVDHIEHEAERIAALLADRPAPAVVIGNEVGSGIVPVNELARTFRDVLGRVNAVFAAHASQAFLVVAGRVLPLQASQGLSLD